MIPMSTNDSLKEKINQNSEEGEEENSSATEKSPDDLEVDKILSSHPKTDQQNTEHRTNPIVSCTLNTMVFLFFYFNPTNVNATCLENFMFAEGYRLNDI